MKILVTGGAGYIGSTLIPMLLEKGYQVRVLDNLLHRQLPLLPHFINKNFEFQKGDIRNKESLQEALRDVDFIIHLAAIVGMPACRQDTKLAEEVNFKATQLLDQVRSKSQPIIFASTESVYGTQKEKCTEETSPNPISDYGVTKLKAEQHLLNAGNVLTYRFATAFGLSPRLRLDLLPNDFVWQALHTKILIIYEKSYRRAFIHIRDIGRAILHAVEGYDHMRDNLYNVGSEKLMHSKEEIANAVRAKLEFFLHFANVGSDPDQRNYEISYEKIRKTGFDPTISLEEGLEELIKGLQHVAVVNPYTNVSG